MGHGIGQVFAMAGFRVTLIEPSQERLDSGLAKVHKNLEKGVARGKVTTDIQKLAVSNLSGNTDVTKGCQDADLVIEAVPEVLDIKVNVFTQAEASAAPHAIFATNTSSLSVQEIGNALRQPARMLGLHFFNPVHIMKLVEIVISEKTDVSLPEVTKALVSKIGKTPILVKDSPGFASSRLGIAIGLEAMRMVQEQVASPADIDTAMRLGYGFPMGPLELTDLVGLDVRLDIAKYLSRMLGERFDPPQLLQDYVAAGRLGKKSGQGFYKWNDGKKVTE